MDLTDIYRTFHPAAPDPVSRSWSWCIELKICSLWPAEWGSTSQPHRVSRPVPQHLSSHFWEVKSTGSFWLQALFQYAHTKKRESQDLLLTDPRSRGEWGTRRWKKGNPPSQVTSEQEIDSRAASTYYL